MREFLASGQVGTIELDAQKKIRESIQQRWDSLGFTAGLTGYVKETVATLYENEAKHLLGEATASDNSGSFETVVFPLIRRVFSKLLANDIVSVQAMNLPIGKLFFILPVTSQREEGINDTGEITGSHKGLMGYERTNRNTGEVEKRFYLPDDVVNSGATVVQFMEKSLYDLFYNDFLFDQSKGKVTIHVGGAAAVVMTAGGISPVTGTLETYAQHNDGTVRNLMLEVSGFSSYNAGKLTGPDGNEMDTETFLASLKVVTKTAIAAVSGTAAFAMLENVPFRVVTQKYGKGIVEYGTPCDAQGKMYIEVDLAKPANGTEDGYTGVAPASLSGLTANAAFEIAWAQYDSLELETEIGEVSFKLDSVTVSVEERKLRATWSPELSQDVSAFHNIDAETELTAILSE